MHWIPERVSPRDPRHLPKLAVSRRSFASAHPPPSDTKNDKATSQHTTGTGQWSLMSIVWLDVALETCFRSKVLVLPDSSNASWASARAPTAGHTPLIPAAMVKRCWRFNYDDSVDFCAWPLITLVSYTHSTSGCQFQQQPIAVSTKCASRKSVAHSKTPSG